jgi:uncharacterized membrane protein YuzA (DUF378 family)
MTKKCGICYVVVVLAALGVINSTLTVLMGTDVLLNVTATIPIVYKIFYVLAGASGILLLVTTFMKPCPCIK